MHPHAFRHTIVGQLIDAGNPMEVVSKYMGHKSVDVTSNHYWVASAQELHDRINNPFTGAHQMQLAADEGLQRDVELLRLKKDKCMDVVHSYNVILGRVAAAGGSASDAIAQIMSAMPTLGDILRIIDADGDAPAGVSAGESTDESGDESDDESGDES